MKIKTIKVGYLQTNCYIIIEDKDALVIDPGDEYEKIKQEIKDLNIEAIIITHRHFDHIGALKYFENIKIYDNQNLEEKNYKIKNFEFQIIKTKGHTEDSISIYFEKEKIMFTGDFIFQNSIGRTDMDTGNMQQMKNSIEKIKKYPKDIKIYPGHGNTTNIQRKQKTE